ncbi:MAG: DUF2027 domain-containing protein [Lunatimonas sp.]|uniref:Smr/MutS family protein n=1 Tax=Lunatimonas sp. TaxID=2060141 RepID=UPI00263B9153|nr:DUF2027 domain-containing protein [Lunatimonas sp.]MCC5938041.1 DUF2027 domain-containing protein [Lunatimonas sp.]
MNVGDKVRLLHGKEEGTITKILPGGEVEIEIEEGFRIPALKSEVVLISEVESTYFGSEKTPTTTWQPKTAKAATDAGTGLYLAYIPFNDHNHGVYLVNNLNKDVLYAVSEVHGENSKTLGAGVAKAKSQHMVEEKSIKLFEEWPALLIQIIPINFRLEKTTKPFERKVKFKASSFFKSKGRAPVLEKEGYVFQLDQTVSDLDVQKLNQELNPKNAVDKPLRQQFSRPEREIDLHIEKLSSEHEFLSNSDKLKIQMEAFEKNLNYAIATGMDEITFIHGIGNGVLRKEIHRYLSQLNHINYFKDTHKSNFGYGATLVKIHE